jgi:hypothetical protein
MAWAAMEGAPKDGSRVLLYARSTLDPDHRFDLVVGRWNRACFSGKWVPSMWSTLASLCRAFGWLYRTFPRGFIMR